jgi:hypothetical protein
VGKAARRRQPRLDEAKPEEAAHLNIDYFDNCDSFTRLKALNIRALVF